MESMTGCGCCHNEDDYWMVLATDLTPDEFLGKMRMILPTLPSSKVQENRYWGGEETIEISSHERIFDAMIRVAAMFGVVLHKYGSSSVPHIIGDWICHPDGENNVNHLGSVDNIMEGGTWEETVERRRLERQADK